MTPSLPIPNRRRFDAGENTPPSVLWTATSPSELWEDFGPTFILKILPELASGRGTARTAGGGGALHV